MKRNAIFTAAVVLLAASTSNAGQPVPVLTQYGYVQGVAEGDLTVFRGIPFAAPPLGDLRWRPPQPATPREGVRPAAEIAPDPYQGDGEGKVSEDCLYLNIWTPAPAPDANLPVLVWIYGGGFSFGSTATPVHNGEHLARKGVVLVSLNYRVGSLGFLAHPELSAESPKQVSGNYGLLDQIAGVHKRYGPYADELLVAYPTDGDLVGRTARNLIRNAAFGGHTWSWARLQARTGDSRVFLYYFDQHAEHAPDSPAADHGMPHGVDVPYVFQTLNPEDPNLTDGDRAISDIVSTYWTNFAKHGDPNGPGLPVWPEFTDEHPQAMHLRDTAGPGPVPDVEPLRVLDRYFTWRRTPEGAAWAQ